LLQRGTKMAAIIVLFYSGWSEWQMLSGPDTEDETYMVLLSF